MAVTKLTQRRSSVVQHYMESERSWRINKNPLLVPILSQINPVHALPTDFFQIHFNIIHAYTLRSSKW